MCGIIGIISKLPVLEKLLGALKIMEYRGYDSAGVVTMSAAKVFCATKTLGPIENLARAASGSVDGNIGIGHTRWATHGAAKIENTHPMLTEDVAVVHNGIIENYLELKEQLSNAGYKFYGDTDSEVIPNIIEFFQRNGSGIVESLLLCAQKLKGAFAVGLISRQNPDMIIGIKNGSPLVVGLSRNGSSCYLASDVGAIVEFCDEVTYLDDRQIVIASIDQYQIFDFDGEAVKIKKEAIQSSYISQVKSYESFMMQEIYEQPEMVARIVAQHVNNKESYQFGCGTKIKKYDHIKIIACGTSLYAAQIAKLWIEEIYDVNVSAEIASEFNTKNRIRIGKKDLFMLISQSGETADTLSALKAIKKSTGYAIAITNNKNSSIAKLADHSIFIDAGQEIAVAATKTFIAQLIQFFLFCGLPAKKLSAVPSMMNEVLAQNTNIRQATLKLLKKSTHNMLFIGRGLAYPLALEGALKIKELAYIAAEGIAAGELKHGSIALIDKNIPVVVLAPENKFFEKICSNIHEIKARGGKIMLVASLNSIKKLKGLYDCAITVPDCESEFEVPFIYAPVLQLIAYHAAVMRGHNIDRPRNLAKSVTVE